MSTAAASQDFQNEESTLKPNDTSDPTSPKEEEEDEIIAEYDVYLSTTLHKCLHVFQFPLRSSTNPYEAHRTELFYTDGVGRSADVNDTHAQKDGPSARSRFYMSCEVETEQWPESFLPQRSSPWNPEGSNTYHYSLVSAPFTTRSTYAVGILKSEDGGSDSAGQQGTGGEDEFAFSGIRTNRSLHLTPVVSIEQFTPAVRPAVRVGPDTRSDGGGAQLPDYSEPGAKHTVVDRTRMPPPRPPTVAVEAQNASLLSEFSSTGALHAREKETLYMTRSAMLNADASTAHRLAYYELDTRESFERAMGLECSTVTDSSNMCSRNLGRGAAFSGGKDNRNKETLMDTLFPLEKLLDSSTAMTKKLVLSRGRLSGAEAAAADPTHYEALLRKNFQNHLVDILSSAQVITTSELLEVVNAAGIVAPSGIGMRTSTASSGIAVVTDEQLMNALKSLAYFCHGVFISPHPRSKLSLPVLRDLVLTLFALSKDATLRKRDIINYFRAISEQAGIYAPVCENSKSNEIKREENGEESAMRPQDDKHSITRRSYSGTDLLTGVNGNVYYEPDVRRCILEVLQSVAEIVPDNEMTGSCDPSDRLWRLKGVRYSIVKAEGGAYPEGSTEWLVEQYKSKFPAEAEWFQEYWQRKKKAVDAGILEMISRTKSTTNIPQSHQKHSAESGKGLPLSLQDITSPQETGSPSSPTGSTESSMNNEQSRQLFEVRKYVRNLFLEHGVIYKVIAKQRILGATRDPRSPFFGASPTILSDACRMELESFTASSFVLRERGVPEVDFYRKFILIAAREKQHGFTSVDLMNRAQTLIETEKGTVTSSVVGEVGKGIADASALSKYPSTIPKQIYTKVLNEVAEYRQGERLWHLKNGDLSR